VGALDDGERVRAADAAAWSAWLERNHATSTGAWLVRGRGADAGRYVDYEDAICEALCVGWIDGPVRVFDDVSSGLWFAPRRARSGWAATNKARIARLEAEGRLRPAGRRALEVARANGAWEMLDDAEAGIEPAELTASLDAVPGARATWDADRDGGAAGHPGRAHRADRRGRRREPSALLRPGRHDVGEDGRMDDRTLWLITAFFITAGTLVAFIVQWRRSRRGGGGRDPFDGPGPDDR
jgi:uncharacterized protein YdeI (YjbR/CyaY-like superfamily)